MSIAKKLTEILPDFNSAKNITEEHYLKVSNDGTKTLLFNDLSLLKINNKKGYLAEARNIGKIKFGGIKQKKGLFLSKKQFYKDLILQNGYELNMDLSFVSIEISSTKKIEYGFDSIYLTSNKDCFHLSLSKSSIKSLDAEDANEIFAVINVDPKLLLNFLQEKKEKQQIKNEYIHDENDVLNLLQSKNKTQAQNKSIEKRKMRL